MLAFLKVLISFPTIFITLVILCFVIWRGIKFIRKHPTVLLGICQLLQSPSGVFALLTLTGITIVTLKQPTVGGTAFAAFCAIIPAALGFFEHREAMAGVISPPLPVAMVEPVPPPNPAKPNNNPTVA